MADVQSIELADLLLLFIYLEVMGMVGNYWSNQSIRLTPIVYCYYSIITTYYSSKKDTDASFLIFESGAILLLAIAIVVLKLRKSKILKIDPLEEIYNKIIKSF